MGWLGGCSESMHRPRCGCVLCTFLDGAVLFRVVNPVGCRNRGCFVHIVACGGILPSPVLQVFVCPLLPSTPSTISRLGQMFAGERPCDLALVGLLWSAKHPPPFVCGCCYVEGALSHHRA